MTLAEIEELARAIEERRTHSMTFEVTTDLARFILRALPVLKAGLKWHGEFQEVTHGPDHCDRCALYHAIDAFRSGDK